MSEFEYKYTPSSCYKWNQNSLSGPVLLEKVNCQHFIIGYQLKEVPKFDETKNSKGYLDTLLRQKTFIDGVNTVFFRRNGISAFLELRLRNNLTTKQIECFLLLRVIRISETVFYSPKTLKSDFESLIPDEYAEFKELTPLEIQSLLELKDQNLVEIRKKPNYISVGSFSYESGVEIAPRGLDSKALEQGRFYVPLSSYLEPKSYNMSSFYKMLQNSKEPVQVRISISAMDFFEYEKNLAIQYHKLITQTYSSINISEVSNNLQSFSKFIGNNSLFSIKIQVASPNETVAFSVANMFSGQLAYGEIKAQTRLECFSLREYNSDIKTQDWQECNHFHYPIDSELNQLQISMDSYIRAFVNRMTYISDSAEIMSVFRLPIANETGLPGIVSKSQKPFYQPNPKNESEKECLNLGKIITSSSRNSLSYSLPIKDLTKHGLIVGATGSGKTNTTLNFVKELTEKGIPFLLIEPVKSEYYEKLKSLFPNQKLNRFNFKTPFTENGDCDSEFFRFNPFIPIKGISVIQHISYIKSCFMAAFPMTEIAPLIFEECLHRFYLKYVGGDEAKMFWTAENPEYFHHLNIEEYDHQSVTDITYFNLNDFIGIVDDYLSDKDLFDDETRNTIGTYLRRRLSKLTKGVLGNTFFNAEKIQDPMHPEKVKIIPNWTHYQNGIRKPAIIPDNIIRILTEPTVIELEHLADNDEKALMMAFILTFLFEYRQTQPSIYEVTANNTHVTIIEEAHRLLSNENSNAVKTENAVNQDGKSKSISLFIDMIAEIRAKGEAIFIVEQIPTKLVSEVIKNTNLKIMHRITSKDDRHYLGEAMNMNEEQKDYITNLKSGEAIIFDEQLDNPVFVKMNRFDS